MRTTILLASTLLAAACGDNAGNPDAAIPQPDADDFASRAVVVAGDFATTGVLSTLDLPDRTMTTNAVAGVAGSDPVIRHHDDLLYIVNRFGGDNITIVRDDTLGLVDQISTGAGTNPQDVAVIGEKLYVAALASSGLIVIDRFAGDKLAEISLAALDPVDGMPDCVSVFAVGTRVYVACGILDSSFMARGPGKLAVIDATTDTVVTTIDLPAENPQGLFARSPATSVYGGDLLIGTVPAQDDPSTGCLARVSTGATPAATCAVTNQVLGGHANHVEVSPDGTLLWLAVTRLQFTPSFQAFGQLRGLDLVSGDLWAGSVSPTQQVINDLAVCPGGVVVVTDHNDAAKGVRVYDNAVEATTTPLSIGLPPSFGGNMVCYRR